jgi:hypothetical protein
MTKPQKLARFGRRDGKRYVVIGNDRTTKDADAANWSPRSNIKLSTPANRYGFARSMIFSPSSRRAVSANPHCRAYSTRAAHPPRRARAYGDRGATRVRARFTTPLSTGRTNVGRRNRRTDKAGVRGHPSGRGARCAGRREGGNGGCSRGAQSANYCARAHARGLDSTRRAMAPRAHKPTIRAGRRDPRNAVGRADVSLTLEAVLEENVALIRSLNEQMRTGISGAVFRGLTNRSTAAEVSKEIRKIADVAKSRADLIAADQLQKLTSRLDQERQVQLGINEFQWQHSHKLHPRPYPRRPRWYAVQMG